jgi:hypothetical protein
MAEQAGSVVKFPNPEFEDYAIRREKIWWLASYPKSGNTWVRAFLNAYIKGGALNINAMDLGIGDLVNYFYQVVSPRPITALTPDEMTMLRPAALLHMTAFYNNPQVPFVVKTHSMFRADINTIPPPITNGAIYIVRDPRDVAVSYAKHCGKSVDEMIEAMANERHALADSGNPIFQLLSSWSSHVRSWLDADVNRLVFRYEDVLERPGEHFLGVLKFLEYQLHQQSFARACAATTFEKMREQEDRFGFKERKHGDRFFNSGKAGGWKDVLSKEQADRIEGDHREVMQTMGYLS